MMASKPNCIDVQPKYLEHYTNGSIQSRSLSPRVGLTGEIPPELSPLDAFAAQSRFLAQQLENNSHGENRISRLAPAAVAQSLNHDRFIYLSSSPPKFTDERPISPVSPLFGHKTIIEASGMRHMSIHPTVCGPNDADDVVFMMPPNRQLTPLEDDQVKDQRLMISEDESGYFGIHGLQSPTPPQCSPISLQTENSVFDTSHQPNNELKNHNTPIFYNDIGYNTSSDQKGLVLKSPSPTQRSPSPYSLSTDSFDEDENPVTESVTHLDRHPSQSESSSYPLYPSTNSSERRLSNDSDASFYTARHSRTATFNFSRPMARSSTALSFPMSQLSLERPQSSHTPFQKTENQPPSTNSEELIDSSISNDPPSSLSLSQSILTQQKIIQGSTQVSQEFLGKLNSSDQSESAPCSPIKSPVTISAMQKTSLLRHVSSDSLERPKISTIPSPSVVPLDSGLHSHNKIQLKKEISNRPATTQSMEQNSAPKTKYQSSLTSSAELTATEHVEKAIEYHQSGVLNKSTYHLRLAARMGHPTGMLLYALACRHGWGMRPNQREGVAWLRKAADEAGLEVADDENMLQLGKKVDFTEMKNKKAQFALSIYELGVSHMNGWGIDQDKALGLRCFEIAGSWGDTDAMAEAGFCYAHGIGCKKDLKKSAKFFRQAEARGMNMIGNSWIYKAKYNETSNDDKLLSRGRSSTASSKDTTKSQENRNKSRTRGIFRRSKVATHT